MGIYKKITMSKKKIIEEYLKDRELEVEGTYKINPYTFLEYFIKYLEEKGHYAKKESSKKV